MGLPDIEKIATSVSAIAVAAAALLGVRQYRTAALAEARMRDSASVENETKIAQQFDALMKTAEGFGPNGPIAIGLASQRAAFRSIVRLVVLHPPLKDAALAGLRALREAAPMAPNHTQLDTAISDTEAVRDKGR